MKASAPRTAVGLVAVMLSAAGLASAGQPEKLSGSIGGWVMSASGVPQMGATVLLYNRADKLIQRVLTDDFGRFLFDALLPETYSLRVTLASFVPAVKRNIVVQPGMRSLMNVNLTGVLSSIELVYSAAGETAVMSDEWKWVLRASSSTRPVLRLRPRIDVTDPGQKKNTAVFSGTRGVVKVSAGDGGHVTAYGNEPDLGTAFALATSLLGANQLQLSGNVGYAAASGIPAAGFRTRFSRELPNGLSPEIRLTMRQLFLPARVGSSLLSGQGDVPVLRTMSVGFMDKARVGDSVKLEYGFSLESVSFIERLNYFSPFARATYEFTEGDSVEFGYSSGAPPVDFLAGGREPGNDLQQDLSALAMFPRVSLRGGRARVQRIENFEVAYKKAVGSRSFSAGAYREGMTNAALTMVAPAGFIPPTDLLPDLLSNNSSVFNIGNYSNFGYMASATQAMGDHLSLTGGFGSSSALIPASLDLQSENPEDLRGLLRHGRRYWVVARLSGQAPRTNTQFATSYRWSEDNTLTPSHLYITQSLRPDIGWNVYVRQPVPMFPALPWKMEATADFRNLLAQGYLPLTTPQGRRLYMMHSPRSVRGGLSFIF